MPVAITSRTTPLDDPPARPASDDWSARSSREPTRRPQSARRSQSDSDPGWYLDPVPEILEEIECGRASYPLASGDSVICLTCAVPIPDRGSRRRVASQLHPNNWVPRRPAESRSVPGTRLRCLPTRTEWDLMGLSGTEWEFVDPPRNAQVVGSSPTSGSRSKASG